MIKQKLNKSQVIELINKAGFVRFDVTEDWDENIDWSCDYTKELKAVIHMAYNKGLEDFVTEAQILEVV
jgi:hypothetical protein